MERKELFAGLVAAAFLFCLATDASGQDMVFTAQDTGEVAAPPPEAQGPPRI